MNLIRFIIAALLLVISAQSQALFMPAGFQTGTDITNAANDTGC